MVDLAVVGGIATAISAAVAAVFTLARARDYFGRRRLDHAKAKLLQVAYDRAQGMETASTLIEVGFDIHTKLEQRAARALVEEGRASLRGNCVWIAVDRTPAIFRQVTAVRGAW